MVWAAWAVLPDMCGINSLSYVPTLLLKLCCHATALVMNWFNHPLVVECMISQFNVELQGRCRMGQLFQPILPVYKAEWGVVLIAVVTLELCMNSI